MNKTYGVTFASVLGLAFSGGAFADENTLEGQKAAQVESAVLMEKCLTLREQFVSSQDYITGMAEAQSLYDSDRTLSQFAVAESFGNGVFEPPMGSWGEGFELLQSSDVGCLFDYGLGDKPLLTAVYDLKSIEGNRDFFGILGAYQLR
jgi:hypothetical protein